MRFIDNNTKVIYLCGGMGNQMFGYAFATALKEKTGCKVIFDKRLFEYKNSRPYMLNVFEIDTLGCPPKEAYRLSKSKRKKFIEKEEFNFDEEVFKTSKKYFYGYWQNERYFLSIAKKIKQSFKFPLLKDKFNIDMLTKIKNSQNSVAIHIRLGDYLENPGSIVSEKYYQNAIKYINSKIDKPKFFVFTDETEENFRKKFKLDIEYEFIGNRNKPSNSDCEVMYLMSMCKHKIIANSTFSWWAAWLSDFDEDGNLKEDQIVCAPSPWLNNSSYIICNRWHKVDWRGDFEKDRDVLKLENIKLKSELKEFNSSFLYKLARKIHHMFKKL